MFLSLLFLCEYESTRSKEKEKKKKNTEKVLPKVGLELRTRVCAVFRLEEEE